MRMKQQIGKATALLLVSALVLSACSKKSDESAAPGSSAEPKNVNIVFWNSGYKTVDENDKTKKKEDFYIFKAVQRFEKAHPGVTIDVQDVPSGDELFTKFQTASIAKNGPDLTVLWSGSYMLRFKQFLEPLDSYFSTEERSRISGWDATTEDFKPDGKPYGVPLGTDGTFVLVYNKKLLADAGIDPIAQRPKNFQEFTAMLDKLKSKSITPLGLYPEGYLHLPDYWIAQTVGTPGLADLVSGKKNFSDPKLIPIMQGWRTLFEQNLAMADASIMQLFLKDQLGMVVGGSGEVFTLNKEMGDRMGIMKFPDFSEDVVVHDGGPGGVGNAFVVTNYSEHKKETVEFVKFLMSKEEQTEKIKMGEASLTVAKDVDVSQITKDPLVKQMQDMANEPSTIFWPDNVYPADLTSQMMSLQSLVSNGKLSAEDFMKKIDKKRDEILKSAK